MSISISDALKTLTENREQAVKDTHARYDATAKRIEETYLAIQLLSSAGFDVPLPSSYWQADELSLTVTAGELPAVRRALDTPLVKTGATVHDEKDRLIRVTLTPKDFPSVAVCYYVQLPKGRRGKKAPKCKIVKVRQKAYTYSTLVCES